MVFLVSSRRRHTRWPRDWSSDVCSSDLFVLLKRPEDEVDVGCPLHRPKFDVDSKSCQAGANRIGDQGILGVTAGGMVERDRLVEVKIGFFQKLPRQI